MTDAAASGAAVRRGDELESFQRQAIDAQERGEHQRAVALFLRAIDVDARDWIAYTCLGNTLRALRRLDDAIAAQRAHAEHRPRLGGSHHRQRRGHDANRARSSNRHRGGVYSRL